MNTVACEQVAETHKQYHRSDENQPCPHIHYTAPRRSWWQWWNGTTNWRGWAVPGYPNRAGGGVDLLQSHRDCKPSRWSESNYLARDLSAFGERLSLPVD